MALGRSSSFTVRVSTRVQDSQGIGMSATVVGPGSGDARGKAAAGEGVPAVDPEEVRVVEAFTSLSDAATSAVAPATAMGEPKENKWKLALRQLMFMKRMNMQFNDRTKNEIEMRQQNISVRRMHASLTLSDQDAHCLVLLLCSPRRWCAASLTSTGSRPARSVDWLTGVRGRSCVRETC
jgi:hypothetical protein